MLCFPPSVFALLLALGASFWAAQITLAQATITGRISDLEHEAPLAGVHVVLLSETDNTAFATDGVTTTDGGFALEQIPKGQWRLQATYFTPTHRIAVTSPLLYVKDEPLDLRIIMPTEHIPWLDTAPVGQKTISTITGEMQAGHIRNARGHTLPDTETSMTPAFKGTLYGQLLAAGQPIPNAALTLDNGKTTRTSSSGWFELSHVTPGDYRLLIKASGYARETEMTIQAGYQHVQLDVGRH